MNVTPDASHTSSAQLSEDPASINKSVGRWAALRAPALADPVRRARYERKKAAVIATRRWLRFIDEARRDLGLSKAELGRRIGMEPSAIRRLFTSAQSNPTLETVVTLMAALDIQWDLQLPPRDGTNGPRARRGVRRTGERATAA